ncbi:MAG TPA: hypothetical protein VF394_06560, partial [Candidatus Acidoferrum sp.]
GTRQRDRPCTQAVYPQHLRDSSLVQTAFAPAPASKNRSIPIVASAPKGVQPPWRPVAKRFNSAKPDNRR